MDLSEVTLLEALEWLRKENYTFMNGRKGYSNCKCNNSLEYNILYIPSIPQHLTRNSSQSSLGYVMISTESVYDMYILVAGLRKCNEYSAIGMFKNNSNITRKNIKGMNYKVENGRDPLKNTKF